MGWRRRRYWFFVDRPIGRAFSPWWSCLRLLLGAACPNEQARRGPRSPQAGMGRAVGAFVQGQKRRKKQIPPLRCGMTKRTGKSGIFGRKVRATVADVSSSGFFALERRAQNDKRETDNSKVERRRFWLLQNDERKTSNDEDKCGGSFGFAQDRLFDCVWLRCAPNSAQDDVIEQWDDGPYVMLLTGCSVRVEV